MHDNLITDRTIIDVIAFTKSAKSINVLDKDEFEQYASMFVGEYDYIFYISPEGLPIEDNAVRETNAEYRDLIDFTIQHLLQSHSHRLKSMYTISGSTKERIQQILNVINS
jgi:transposase-like protein